MDLYNIQEILMKKKIDLVVFNIAKNNNQMI